LIPKWNLVETGVAVAMEMLSFSSQAEEVVPLASQPFRPARPQLLEHERREQPLAQDRLLEIGGRVEVLGDEVEHARARDAGAAPHVVLVDHVLRGDRALPHERDQAVALAAEFPVRPQGTDLGSVVGEGSAEELDLQRPHDF
jgi:hypothetical protein